MVDSGQGEKEKRGGKPRLSRSRLLPFPFNGI